MLKICLANHFDAKWRYQTELLKAFDPLMDSAVVIVPEQYTLQAESELLSLLNNNGLLHIEVLSFKRIVQRLLQNTIYDGRQAISELGKQLLLAEIIENGKEQLELYAESYKIKGFLEQLASVITDFRHQGIALDDLTKLKQQADDAPLFDQKIREISYIYGAYLARLDSMTFDDDGLINYAAGLVKEKGDFADKTLIINGFSSMTGSEQKLLIELVRCSVDSYLHIIVDQTEAVDGYARAFLRSLTAQLNDAEYQIIENFIAETAAVKSFKSIFATTNPTSNGIDCFVAKDNYDELSAVFCDMVQNYQTTDCRWRDMAIVTNQLSNYYRPIKRLAELYKLPVFIDARRPAITHYVVDFILSLLRAMLYHYRTRDVIKLIKTGFFDLTEQQIWQIENTALSFAIKGQGWFGDWPQDDELLTVLAPIVNRLKDLKDSLIKDKTAKQKIALLRHFLDDLNVLERVATDVDRHYQQGDYDRSEELAQVYNIIDDVFYQVYAIGEMRALTLEQFYNLLKLGFENHEIGIIPQVQDYVTVGNIKRTRLAQLKLIYFVGMDETAIPSAAPRSTIFNDQEMTRLQSIGLERLATQSYNYDEEVYKSYENILKSVSVKWYYSEANTEGDQKRPSIWFQQLGAAHLTDLAATKLASLGLDEAYLDKLLLDLANDHNASVDYQTLQSSFQSDATALKLAAFNAGRHYKNTAETLDEHLISELYGSQISASVSRLESYATCPYQHFVSYGLKPKIEKEVDLDFLDIGDFYHKIIENVMNEWLTLGVLQFDEKRLAEIYQKHYEIYLNEHYRFRYNAKNRYFAARLKGVLATALSQIIRQLTLGSFNEIRNEVKFANQADAALPALNLYDRAGCNVTLRGVIDRLDLAAVDDMNYLRIVDYKSSTKQLNVNEVLHGLQLQLMIYLNAACQFMQKAKQNKVVPFGAFYFSVDEITLQDDNAQLTDTADSLLTAHQLNGVFLDQAGTIELLDSSFAADGTSKIIDAKRSKDGIKLNRQSVSAVELGILKDYALLMAKRLATRLYSGAIEIAPVMSAGKAPCRYCAYHDICRFDDSKQNENYRRYAEKGDKAEIFATMEEQLANELD